MGNPTLNSVRWTARILGGILAALLLYLVVGHALSPEGLPNPFTQPPGVRLEFLGLFAIWVGLILGWRWEGFGGLVALAGATVFHVVEGKLWLPGPFALVELAAVLFLVYWCASKFCKRRPEAPSHDETNH